MVLVEWAMQVHLVYCHNEVWQLPDLVELVQLWTALPKSEDALLVTTADMQHALSQLSCTAVQLCLQTPVHTKHTQSGTKHWYIYSASCQPSAVGGSVVNATRQSQPNRMVPHIDPACHIRMLVQGQWKQPSELYTRQQLNAHDTLQDLEDNCTEVMTSGGVPPSLLSLGPGEAVLHRLLPGSECFVVSLHAAIAMPTFTCCLLCMQVRCKGGICVLLPLECVFHGLPPMERSKQRPAASSSSIIHITHPNSGKRRSNPATTGGGGGPSNKRVTRSKEAQGTSNNKRVRLISCWRC